MAFLEGLRKTTKTSVVTVGLGADRVQIGGNTKEEFLDFHVVLLSSVEPHPVVETPLGIKLPEAT